MADRVDSWSRERLDDAARVARNGVDDRLWPGCVAAVGTGPDLAREFVFGSAEDWTGGARPMTIDTVFDVASLTKVLATLPSALLLVQRGEIGLEDVAADYVPGLDRRVRVRQLLTHTSGLPSHCDFRTASSAAELAESAARLPLVAEPGTVVAYSDPGFIVLGALVEAVSGSPLDEFAAREVFAPLGSSATYQPPASWLSRIAATELVDGRPVHGRVHDENAAAAGDAVGHAGLFASAADVRACLAMWFADGPLLDEGLRAEALRDATAGLGGDRGLGWTCRGDGHDILSDGWGPRAVSHTGFTGTSVAFDPDTQRWAVFLTNAVHYGRGRPDVLAARRRFHAALVGD